MRRLTEEERKFGAHKKPEVMEAINRRDDDFENTGRARIGGSSYSSGVFRERTTDKLWIGKADPRERVEETEGEAVQEKLAADVYAYYGASIPSMTIARLELTNTGLAEDQGHFAVHILSELIDDFHDYRDQHQFDVTAPNPNGTIVLPDGQTLPERGLGHILAVASFIRDVDVIGSGANIGYVIKTDAQEQRYAQTVKIDPGAAFDNNPQIVIPPRHLRTALQAAPNTLAFDDLPQQTQREFLMTLHDIINTHEVEMARFFNRYGGERFLLHDGRTMRNMTDFLIARRADMATDYQDELAQTQADYREAVDAHQAQRQAQKEERVRLAAEEEARRQHRAGLRLNQAQITTLEMTVEVPVGAVLYDHPEHIAELRSCIQPLRHIEAHALMDRLSVEVSDLILKAMREGQVSQGGRIGIEGNAYVARDADDLEDGETTENYTAWLMIRECLRTQNRQEFTARVEQLRNRPNYDPQRLIAISDFQQRLEQANLPEVLSVQLLRLRELYLEMTPLHEYQYGQSYRPFNFRIGNVPCNLDQIGTRPTVGEVIPVMVERMVERRIEIHEESTQQLQSQLESAEEAAERARLTQEHELERQLGRQASLIEVTCLQQEDMERYLQKHDQQNIKNKQIHALMKQQLRENKQLLKKQAETIKALRPEVVSPPQDDSMAAQHKLAEDLRDAVGMFHGNRATLNIDQSSQELAIVLSQRGDNARNQALHQLIEEVYRYLPHRFEGNKIIIPWSSIHQAHIDNFESHYNKVLNGVRASKRTEIEESPSVTTTTTSTPTRPAVTTSAATSTTATMVTTSTTQTSVRPAGGRRLGSTLSEPTSASLTVEQQALQDQLVSVCEKGELADVKALINNQGADPLLADSRGVLPLGAAIWGCNMKVVQFVERLVPNYPEYWQACAEANRRCYGAVLPGRLSTLGIQLKDMTFGDLKRVSQNQDSGWGFIDSEWILKVSNLRGISRLRHTFWVSYGEFLEKHPSFLNVIKDTPIFTGSTRDFQRKFICSLGGGKKIKTAASRVWCFSQFIKKALGLLRSLGNYLVQKGVVATASVSTSPSATATTTATTTTVTSVGGPALFQQTPSLSAEQQALQNLLVRACEKGELAQVKELIYIQGADPLLVDSRGVSPLGAAIWGCNMALVKFLETQVANLNAQVWQACVEVNQRVYGNVVPEIPSFSDCSFTYGALLRWYNSIGGQGHAMYSDWYRSICKNTEGSGIIQIVKILKTESGRDIEARKMAKTYGRKPKPRRFHVSIHCRKNGKNKNNDVGGMDKPLRDPRKGGAKADYALQHDGYRVHVEAMENYVAQKSTPQDLPRATPQ